jgi:hypothetical protein
METQERRKQLKQYFYKLELKKPLMWLGICAFLSYYMVTFRVLAIVGLLVSLGIVIYRYYKSYTRPNDETVDEWLREDIANLIKLSYHKLGIEKSDEVADPLFIISPVYWSVRGIDLKEVALKKGKDNLLRFSVYQITIFHLHEYILGAYICNYNFLRGTSLNEVTNEYHYKDVVSVATQEVSSNYSLPDGHKLIHVKEFRLSVASGESIRVTINPDEIARREQGELPPTGADQAVSVIRNMLRTKKV